MSVSSISNKIERDLKKYSVTKLRLKIKVRIFASSLTTLTFSNLDFDRV